MNNARQPFVRGGEGMRLGWPVGLRRWAALPIILAGTFMITLDFFIVNVAIPSMQGELHADPAAIQLVVAGYGLALAAGLILGGRLGDIYGRRRMFALGLALFTLTSAACGLAPTSSLLVLARVGQGLAAALLSPQALALLSVVYTGDRRARAFSAYGLTLGLAAVLGQLIGGLLIQADLAGLGWRACFLVNVPIGVLVLILIPRLIPESRAEGRARLDLVGAALVTLGLTALILPLVEGREQGWPLWTWLCLGLSLPVLAAFTVHQHRLGRHNAAPLVDLRLFANRSFTVGILTTLVFYAGMASFFLVFALYMQVGHGLSALASGAIFTPLAVGFFAASMSAPRYTPKLGRQALTVGALVLAVGQILLALCVAAIGSAGPITVLIPALVIGGAGMGMVIAPLTSDVLKGVAPRHVGAASGVLTTSVQIGGALGVALIGVIFYGSLGSTTDPRTYPHAFGVSLVYLIVLALAVAALVQCMPHGGAEQSMPAGSVDRDTVESSSVPAIEPVVAASRESAA